MPQGALDEVSLHRVDSLDALWACARWAGERRETPLMADTESAGLNPFRDRLRLCQLGDMRHGWAFPPGWWGAFRELVERYSGLVGFHNSPYDWRVLKVHLGMEPSWERTEDTLLLGHIADSLRLAGLKPRATQEVDSRALRGGQVLAAGMEKQHWTWDTVPDDWAPYWTYAALDPVLTAHLWNTPSFRRAREAHRYAYDIERATARICVNMMLAGMLTDVPFVTERIEEIQAYLARAGGWLRAEFGIGNVNSTAQVVRAMNAAGIPTLVYTDKGNPCLNKEALKFYKLRFPQHAALIDAIGWCRKGDKLVGSYLQKFLDLRGPGDTMHYSIHSCRARTTRMSVTDPPMQTFDRDVAAVRGSFIPWPGSALITIDADQIEARLAAHFSRDPNMIAEFRRCDELGLKFFIEMASKIYSEVISKKDPRYTWTKNACVPLDSRILTRRGWLGYDQVRIGDETIGLNLDTGRSEWTQVTGVHVYPESTVQSIGNKHRFRLRATPDHKWAVMRTYGNNRAQRRLELIPQNELNRHRDEIVLAAPLDDQGTIKLTEQEARILGWLLSDGRLVISYEQTRVAKRKILGEIFQMEKKFASEIDLLLHDVPHKRYVARGDYVTWHISPGWLRPLLAKTGIYDEWLRPEVLACSLSPRSRAFIAETMRKADGDPFVKGSEWRADFYAMLVYLLGEAPRVRVRPPGGSVWQKKDCWSVGRTRPKLTMQRVTIEDDVRQPVWCVTTGLGTWTMRQGKVTTITGNTYAQIYGSGLEKAAATAGVPVETMRPAYAGLATLYPNVKRLMDFLINANEGQRPRVQTIDGRWLYTYRGKEYALLNTLIQGSAATILKLGLINLDAAGLGPYLRLPVHDEYLLEAPSGIAADVLREAERILTDRENFAVPITWSGDVLEHRWVKA